MSFVRVHKLQILLVRNIMRYVDIISYVICVYDCRRLARCGMRACALLPDMGFVDPRADFADVAQDAGQVSVTGTHPCTRFVGEECERVGGVGNKGAGVVHGREGIGVRRVLSGGGRGCRGKGGGEGGGGGELVVGSVAGGGEGAMVVRDEFLLGSLVYV